MAELLTAAAPSCDPASVAAWAWGWTIARGTPPPVQITGGLRIDTGTRKERVRFILDRLHAARITTIAAAEIAAGACIKLLARTEDLSPLLPPGWALHEQRHMMGIAFGESTRRSVKPRGDYALFVRVAGPMVSVTARHGAGGICAAGQMALHGRHAIFDDIHTDLAHRRRGLGAAIVTRLMQAGFEAGATTGLLVATPDGHALYAACGWRVLTPYASAVRL